MHSIKLSCVRCVRSMYTLRLSLKASTVYGIVCVAALWQIGAMVDPVII